MAGFGGSVKLTGESEYRKALKQITDNLTVLSSEMNVVNSMYDKGENSTDKLIKQSQVLVKRLDEQNKKLAEAKKMLDNAKNSTDANATTVAKWQNEVNKAQAEVNKTTRELNSNTKAIDDNVDALKDNNNEIKNLAENEDKAGKGAITLGDLIKGNIISDFVVSGIKRLGSAIAEMTMKFVDFVKGGVENASNLQEVQNVVDVVFGESAKAVEDFSKKASTEFGMTELSVKKFAGSMGAMLDSMGVSDSNVSDMSLKLVGLTGDMASFYNLDHEETWSKIRSGIAGETEPLKALGINMSVANLEAYALSQGIETAYKEMTQAEQVQLRYNYLMEQTANAQGDFARTSDGFANQQRILSLQFENLATTMGTFLLPTINEIIIAFNNMMSGEIGLSEGIEKITQVVVNLANSIIEKLPELLNAGITMLDTIVNGFISALPKLLPAISQLMTDLLTFIVQSLPMIIDAGVTIILSLVQGIASSLPTLIPAIYDTIYTIVENLINNIDLVVDAGIQLIVGLAQGIINAIPIMLEKIPVIIENLIQAFYRNEAKIFSAGFKLMVQMASGLLKAIPQIIATIPKIIGAIVRGFANGMGDMVEIGKQLLSGLWQGMTQWAVDLYHNIVNLGKKIVGWFKGVFGINSPSTVMAEQSAVMADQVGKNLALGLGVGFENTMSSVADEMTNAVPTNFDINTNSINSGATNNSGAFANMVGAFKEALKEVNIVLDDEIAGRFVTDTVEKVVYS